MVRRTVCRALSFAAVFPCVSLRSDLQASFQLSCKLPATGIRHLLSPRTFFLSQPATDCPPDHPLSLRGAGLRSSFAPQASMDPSFSGSMLPCVSSQGYSNYSSKSDLSGLLVNEFSSGNYAEISKKCHRPHVPLCPSRTDADMGTIFFPPAGRRFVSTVFQCAKASWPGRLNVGRWGRIEEVPPDGKFVAL